MFIICFKVTESDKSDKQHNEILYIYDLEYF
jgi:hypothetical protein